jgi:protein-disulfide isomerase
MTRRAATAALLALGCFPPAAPERQIVELELPLSGPWVGRADAPVALVEFGSHGCAGCWRFTREALPRLMTEFIEPGALRYRYVDVAASPLAAVVECQSAERGFPATRAALYQSLQDSAGRAAANRTIQIPVECLSDPAGESRRAMEAGLAQRMGVPGTPTFLIGRYHGGGRVVGWVEFGFSGADSLVAIVQAAQALVEAR